MVVIDVPVDLSNVAEASPSASPTGGVVVHAPREQSPDFAPPVPVRRRSLLDISDDIMALDDLLDECGGDVTDVEGAIDQWFGELGIERDRKLDGYASLIAELTNRAEVRETRAAEMTELARLDKKKVEFLKSRLLMFFQAHAIERVDTERFRFTRCKNGGRQPMWIEEAEKLPDEFRRTVIEYKPETDKIREALAKLPEGEGLPFAKLMPRGEHIRIK